MKVLSLFDGMACGYEALVRAGIKIDKYYASEIDKYAIQIATKNHPDIIEIGDVCNLTYWYEDYSIREIDSHKKYECGPIDLLIGGSPCQGFSVAGKMLNFNDPRSRLFFEYLRLLKEVKPKYFLLENVKMKKEWQDLISHYLGVEPIEINSSLVSAQSRKRLYRTNIPNITQPKDKGILLKDILQDEVDEKYYYSAERWNRILSGKYDIVKRLEDAEKKSNTLTTVGGGNHEKKILVSHCPASREFDGQGFKEDKSPTLCARDYKDPKVAVELISVRGGEVRVKQATKQGYIVANDGDGISLAYPNSTTRRGRVIHQKSNTLTTGSDAHVLLKNKDIVVGNQFNNRVFTDKSGTIGTCAGRTNKQGMGLYYKEVKPQYYIRKLTPIEYERLQTLEDNYTAGVSDTQRYKMCGNGWTVDVIAHIFRSIPS